MHSVTLRARDCIGGSVDLAARDVCTQLVVLVEEAMTKVQSTRIGRTAEEIIGVPIEASIDTGDHQADSRLSIVQILLQTSYRIVRRRLDCTVIRTNLALRDTVKES